MNIKLLDQFKNGKTRLVAVSKTRSVNDIKKLYDLGQRDFGENRVQELQSKVDKLPEDIKWHMIGHLQKNKVKYIAGYVDWIHSVDSFSLLQKINKEAEKNNRSINVLLQFKIAIEESKYGFDYDGFMTKAQTFDFQSLSHVNYRGVMGMASFVEDCDQIKSEFLQLKSIHEQLKEDIFSFEPRFSEISMGMSGDYELAISCGSTMVRIGTLLFS